MKRILKNELYRAFFNKTLLVILIFECILAIGHFVIYGIYPLESMQEWVNVTKDPYRAPNSVFAVWMGSNAYNLPAFLHAMLLPLLAVLPYGASYYDDIKKGFIKNVYMRTNRLPYLQAKYISVFSTGCLVAVVPLCLNFLLMLTIYPALMPELSTSRYPIFATDMWYQIFYTHPFLYVLGFILINAVFGGLCAVLGLFFTFLTDYKYIVLLMPFLLQMFLYAVGNLIGNEVISPVFYLQAGSGIASAKVIVIELLVMFVFGTSVFFWRGGKGDVY